MLLYYTFSFLLDTDYRFIETMINYSSIEIAVRKKIISTSPTLLAYFSTTFSHIGTYWQKG